MSTTLELDFPSLTEAAPTIADDTPAWLAEQKRSAWQRFLEIPQPVRRDETWRFANLKHLRFEGYRSEAPAPEKSEEIIARSTGVEKPLAKFIFINGELVSRSEGELPSGVICLPLSEAAEKHPELVEKHFMQHESILGSAKWQALHQAHVNNGTFVYVPKNAEVEGVIEVFHWAQGEKTTIYPHTLIVTEDHAKVRVIDYFQSADEQAALCLAYNDLYAGPGSKLDYLCVQAFNEATKVIQLNETDVHRDATAVGFVLNTGAAWVRNEMVSRLQEPGAHSDMLSVSIPWREQEYDQRTYQLHNAPASYSDLLYKNTLFDKTSVIFSGIIVVEDGAHQVDAYQKCRNLFLSEDAISHSLPGLQIKANDVKCSHGATNASISEEEIFYLTARGITPERARELIARGFSVEVLDRLGDCDSTSAVLRFLDEKLDRVSASRRA